jgi:methylated-DNA-[protein]-cysteine S-methyltransferase
MKTLLDAGLGGYDSGLLPDVQQGIIAYFQGDPVSFDTIDLLDQGKTQFAQDVYAALSTTSPGVTVSYSELASMAGHFGAARAVGRAMATNPCPLIVPCHRVVTATGEIGGFSAQGGLSLKRRLLQHEKEFWGGSSA